MFHFKIFCHIFQTESCMLFQFQYIYREVHVLYFQVSCNGSQHMGTVTLYSTQSAQGLNSLMRYIQLSKKCSSPTQKTWINTVAACRMMSCSTKKNILITSADDAFSKWKTYGLGLLALNPHDYYLWRALEVKIYVNTFVARNERRYSLCNGKC
jgi:hypothetical protein